MNEMAWEKIQHPVLKTAGRKAAAVASIGRETQARLLVLDQKRDATDPMTSKDINSVCEEIKHARQLLLQSIQDLELLIEIRATRKRLEKLEND